MSTLGELVEKGVIVKIEVDLDFDELSHRCLYGTPDFIGWLDEVMPGLELMNLGLDIDPKQQIDDIFYSYVIGEDICNPCQFRRLERKPDSSVWEFKTVDLRVLGWFVKKDHFVCTFGVLKEDTLRLISIDTLKAKTMYYRDHLDLDEPKVVDSKEYEDVLSIKN